MILTYEQLQEQRETYNAIIDRVMAETEAMPVDEVDYIPEPTCGQCEHFYQGKVARQRTPNCGYCPLRDWERNINDKPCSFYREYCPF